MDNYIGRLVHKNSLEVRRFCSKHANIYIFGAGIFANYMYRYLVEEEISVTGVVISDGQKTKKHDFYGMPIIFLSEIKQNKDNGYIVCVRRKLQKEVYDLLISQGVNFKQIYIQDIYQENSLLITCDDAILNGERRDCSNNSDGFFKNYRKLDEIGTVCGTDKASNFHNYLNKYEFFLQKYREKCIKILELGIFRGESLKMWKEYFPNANVYGVDIDVNCENIKGLDDCKIIINDLSDESVLKRLAKIEPDIVIDDASHIWSHQIKSLYHILPAITSGGIFIMEDLETSYNVWRNGVYADAAISTYDFLAAISDVVCGNEDLNENKYLGSISKLKKHIEYLASMIEMISFIHGSCVIIKRHNNYDKSGENLCLR